MARRKKTKSVIKRNTVRTTYRRKKRIRQNQKLIQIKPIQITTKNLQRKIKPLKIQNKNLQRKQNKFIDLTTKPEKRRKRTCEERLKNNDRARRTNFFKARARGGSARPEHNRRHKRCGR